MAAKAIFNSLMSPEETSELQAEASMLCTIHHPHILRFYGVATDPEGPTFYIVTDLKTSDLRQLIENSQAPSLKEVSYFARNVHPVIRTPQQVLRMLLEVASALEYLHARSIAHRDLKPSNVLVDEGKSTFLCDFGLSKVWNSPKVIQNTRCLCEGLHRQRRGEDVYGWHCCVYGPRAGKFRRSSSAHWRLRSSRRG